MPILKFVAIALLVSAQAFAQPAPPPDAGTPDAPPPDAAPSPPPDAPAPAPEVKLITVSGRVIDKLGQPIRNAKVGVEGSEDQVHTDRGGRFTMKAPMNATLVVEKNGLEVGLAIVSGPILDDIVLLDLDTLGEQIEVQGSAPVDAPGSAVIDRTELQRVPGTGGDVVKALSAMPGVVNQQLPLGYSGVVIRGSSP